jgi:hypothetical protein
VTDESDVLDCRQGCTVRALQRYKGGTFGTPSGGPRPMVNPSRSEPHMLRCVDRPIEFRREAPERVNDEGSEDGGSNLVLLFEVEPLPHLYVYASRCIQAQCAHTNACVGRWIRFSRPVRVLCVVCLRVLCTYDTELLLLVEAGGEQQRKKVDEQVRVLPDDEIALAAELLEACDPHHNQQHTSRVLRSCRLLIGVQQRGEPGQMRRKGPVQCAASSALASRTGEVC